jgi:hypothetical protein
MYFNRVYDFQKVLYEDPELISIWFRLVENIKAKYRILDYDFYNFDEIGFMISTIYVTIIVTCVDRYIRSKIIQLGNRE